jgi:hypothetical protein
MLNNNVHCIPICILQPFCFYVAFVGKMDDYKTTNGDFGKLA